MTGLAAARARGRVLGRPSWLFEEQRKQARRMYDEREFTVEQIGQALGVSRTSVYRAVQQTSAFASATPTAEPAEAAPGPSRRQARVPRAADDDSGAARGGPAESVPEPAARKAVSKRRDWLVVEAEVDEPDGPVVVVGSHGTERQAVQAAGRVRRQFAGADHDASGVRVVVVHRDQVRSHVVYDVELRRSVVVSGPASR